jgi:tetratricopeptide (TPR) repeat protein
MDEDLAMPYNNLGLHYFHSGDYDRGLTNIGKALDLEPENPDFLFNTTQIYLTYFPQIEKEFGMDKEKLYKEAMRMSKDAAKYAPNDFQILQDYAANFYAGENFGVEVNWSEAALAWQQALPMAPSDADKFYVLLNEGRTWKFANQPGKAAEALNKALVYEPDSRVAKQLLEELASGPTEES